MTLFPWFGGESKSPTMERMSEVSELPNSLNLAFLESLYEVYLRDSTFAGHVFGDCTIERGRRVFSRFGNCLLGIQKYQAFLLAQ
jgi:hypothetical protein